LQDCGAPALAVTVAPWTYGAQALAGLRCPSARSRSTNTPPVQVQCLGAGSAVARVERMVDACHMCWWQYQAVAAQLLGNRFPCLAITSEKDRCQWQECCSLTVVALGGCRKAPQGRWLKSQPGLPTAEADPHPLQSHQAPALVVLSRNAATLCYC
jgi:hypothetical protein